MPEKNTQVNTPFAAVCRYAHTSTDHTQQERVIVVNIYTVAACRSPIRKLSPTFCLW